MPRKAKWTVLTHVAFRDNLEPLGRMCLMEILNVGSTPDVVQGVLYDSASPSLQGRGAARYVMGDAGRVEYQEQLGQLDPGDPNELIATAKWLFRQHPAERYGLVLSSSIYEVSPEAHFVNGSEERPLDVLGLAQVPDGIANSVGQPLELLGLDVSLMSNVEFAYEVRKAVRYLVASEELEPGRGWPFQKIFGALRANPDMSGAEFARLIVDRYVSFHTTETRGGEVTKVALDLGEVDALVEALYQLAVALRVQMSDVGDILWQVQRGAWNRETRGGKRAVSKFNWDFYDIGSLADGLARSAGVPDRVKSAAVNTTDVLAPGAGVRLAEGHCGSWMDGIAGISVYLVPPGLRGISPAYSKLGFARETQWDELLEAYHALYVNREDGPAARAGVADAFKSRER